GHQQDGNDLGDQQRRHRSGAHQACEEHAAFMGPHLHAQQSGEDIQHLQSHKYRQRWRGEVPGHGQENGKAHVWLTTILRCSARHGPGSLSLANQKRRAQPLPRSPVSTLYTTVSAPGGHLKVALCGGSADLFLSRAAGRVLDPRTALDRRSRAGDERAALLNTQIAAHPGFASAVYAAGGVGGGGAAGAMSMAPCAAAEAPVESATLAVKLAALPFTEP